MRLDKWLWAARFFKTRSLAQQAVAGGRVQLNGDRTKPAHEVQAEEARKLYQETAQSRAERERVSDLRRWGAEPAATLKGRPTKRDRRRIEEFEGE